MVISPEEILGAGREALREDELGVRAVARRLGVTPPALYRHTNGLQGLHDLIVEDVAREVEELLTRDHARASTEDPVESSARLVTCANRFRGWALTHTAEFDLLLRHGNLSTSQTSKWAVAIACPPAIWSTVLGLVVVEVLGHSSSYDGAAQLRNVIETMFRGTAAPTGVTST